MVLVGRVLWNRSRGRGGEGGCHGVYDRCDDGMDNDALEEIKGTCGGKQSLISTKRR